MLLGQSDAVREFAYADVFGSVPRGGVGEATRKVVNERAIRNHQFKLFVTSEREEFFDLASDPYEKNNLSDGELTGAGAEAYEQLSAQLAELLASEPD